MGIDGRRACVAGVDGLDRAEVFDLEVWEKDSAGRGEGTLKFVCILLRMRNCKGNRGVLKWLAQS